MLRSEIRRVSWKKKTKSFVRQKKCSRSMVHGARNLRQSRQKCEKRLSTGEALLRSYNARTPSCRRRLLR